MKTFHDKYKQKEFMTTEPALQKILKGILHAEKEKKKNPQPGNTGKINPTR
jgi:hypothetical protein